MKSSHQNHRNTKISKAKQSVGSSLRQLNDDMPARVSSYTQVPEISPMLKDVPQFRKKQTSVPTSNKESSSTPTSLVTEHEGASISPLLNSTQETFTRRQKLLKRIHSLKQQKGVINSQNYPIRYKKHLKGGSKSIKARLRQRRLRLKYLRQHERPVTSYLYMHNIPRKVKRRLPLLKPTFSPQARTEVTVN